MKVLSSEITIRYYLRFTEHECRLMVSIGMFPPEWRLPEMYMTAVECLVMAQRLREGEPIVGDEYMSTFATKLEDIARKRPEEVS